MKKFKPGGVGADLVGAWVQILSGRGCRCSVFVEKTNKEKKTRKRVIFYKKVLTQTRKRFTIQLQTRKRVETIFIL